MAYAPAFQVKTTRLSVSLCVGSGSELLSYRLPSMTTVKSSRVRRKIPVIRGSRMDVRPRSLNSAMILSLDSRGPAVSAAALAKTTIRRRVAIFTIFFEDAGHGVGCLPPPESGGLPRAGFDQAGAQRFVIREGAHGGGNRSRIGRLELEGGVAG